MQKNDWCMSCSNCATYWECFNQNFCCFRLCSNLKIFYQESAQLWIPASVTPYDGSLHLHMNLLINTHYHIWAKLADNSQAVFKQILLEGMSVIFPDLKTFKEATS